MTGRMLARALAAAVLVAAGAAGAADPYPTRPITIVVPFGTGSGSDVVARLLSRFIVEEMGGTVVVENRPGANAMIGSQAVAAAAPDGHTVLMGSGTANAANYALYAGRITYRPESFTTVALLYVSPPVVFAGPGISGDSVRAVVASAKAQPRGANCGSGNAVTLVACELLKRLTGTEIVAVSYKGNGQALADLAGGQLTLAIADMAAAAPFVAQGRVRPIAVAAPMRLPSVPDLPSAKDQGVDLDFLSWNALFVPAGSPAVAVERLNAAARRMLASPEWDKQNRAAGGLPVAGDVKSSEAFVAAEVAKWARYVRETGVRMD